MTSVAPLRSIFHPLAKWITCLQGTKLTHFFPSLAFSVCLYLMYCIRSYFHANSQFPLMWKKKKKSHRSHHIYLSILQKHFLSPNSKDVPSFFPPPQETILFPTVTSLLPALFLSAQKSWQAGGTTIQEATPAKFSSTRAWSLAGTQQGASSRRCSSLLLGTKDHPLAQKLYWSSFLFSRTRVPSLEMQSVGCSTRVLVGR